MESGSQACPPICADLINAAPNNSKVNNSIKLILVLKKTKDTNS